MRKITKRSAIIATAAVVAVGGAGAAFAAWSLNGSGDASTTAGSASPLTVSGVQVVGTLVPGSKASVQFTAQNPNSFPVKISGIQYSDVVVTGAGMTGCPTNNLQQVGLTDAPLPTDLALPASPAGGSTKTITYANSVRLKANPDNGCQNATFSFKVNLTVASDNV
jgi:hypothetical protein